jgi:hypothetical protein
VIGIDQYVAWPRLSNAVSDAAGAARLFTQLGFVEVTVPLLDGAATGEAMRCLVTDDLAQLAPDDSLVLFFAGHGHTHTAHFGDVSVKTGYVIPVDAGHSGGRVATWLRLDSWLSDIARLPPRHILVIIDACHSGVALGALVKWRDAVPAPASALDDLQARRSRRIITSALDDQRAMDSGPYPGHSLFTGCLIEGLSGGLSECGRHVATGSEIGLYLQRRVSSYPMSTQTPDFGALELDDRGEIVVPILRAKTGLTEPEPTAPSVESAAPQLLESAESAASTAPRLFLRNSPKERRAKNHALVLPVFVLPAAPLSTSTEPTTMSPSEPPLSNTVELAKPTVQVPSSHARLLPAVVKPAASLATPTRVSRRTPDPDRALVISAAALPNSTVPAAALPREPVPSNTMRPTVAAVRVPPPPSRLTRMASSLAARHSARNPTRSRANMAREAAVAGTIAILGGAAALGYTVTQYATSGKSDVQRETMTSAVDPPVKSVTPPPLLPPPAPASKIVMEMPSADDVKSTGPGVIETIQDEAVVKAGDVIVRFVGDKPLAAEIESITISEKRVQDQIDACIKWRDAAHAASNTAAEAAAETDIADRQKTMAVKQGLLATKTTELEKFLIHARSNGTFTPVSKPGQKVAANDVVARIQRGVTPVATFKVRDATPFVANASIEVTVGKDEQRVTCTIAEVQPDSVKVACPLIDPTAPWPEGTDVTLARPIPKPPSVDRDTQLK